MLIFICLVFIALFFTSIFIYFLPSFVAYHRKHHNFAAIFVLNLLLGWSFIGWAIALVWALTRTHPYQAQIVNNRSQIVS